MIIKSPSNLPYPVTVTGLLRQPTDDINRTDNLFNYTFTAVSEETGADGEWTEVKRSFAATFASDFSGQLIGWKINKGDVIARPGTLLVEIKEPCSHEIQWGKLCAICGQDMTEVAFSTVASGVTRAPINMSHSQTALKISEGEAGRVSGVAMRRLLTSRKLSLVVDLDQTIIHATVDPSIADWQADPNNPNYEAVRDVRRFQLSNDNQVAARCWYYIKFRPGLKEFLEQMSTLYEMHIYTMGTRAYARQIVELIDPDHHLFGDRVLSRDESGSFAVKRLQRLFPNDTNMVVVIDDRGDVWNWSKNLVKVVPYDFFVGIGDINAGVLPQQVGLAQKAQSGAHLPLFSPPPAAAPSQKPVENDSTPRSDLSPATEPASVDSQVSVPDSAVAETVSDSTGSATNIAAEQPAVERVATNGGLVSDEAVQESVIVAQLEGRPLQRMQEQLDQASADSTSAPDSNGQRQTPAKARKHLLHDDDSGLLHLEAHLRSVHSSFYSEFDLIREDTPLEKVERDQVPNVAEVMEDLKIPVMEDLVIVFTGLIPLGMDIHTADISMWAKSFGAKIATSVSRRCTHVVASREMHTAKLRQGLSMPWVRVVSIDWLLECFAQWKLVDETPYLIKTSGDTAIDPVLAGVLSGSEAEHEEDDGEAIVEDVAFNMTPEDWAKMQAEVDEFLESSDGEDSDGDGDDGDDGDGDDNDGDGGDDDGDDGDDEEEDGEEDGKSNLPPGHGTKRKRAEADIPVDSADSLPEKKRPREDHDTPETLDQTGSDFDEDALEAEVMAALAADSADSVGSSDDASEKPSPALDASKTEDGGEVDAGIVLPRDGEHEEASSDIAGRPSKIQTPQPTGEVSRDVSSGSKKQASEALSELAVGHETNEGANKELRDCTSLIDSALKVQESVASVRPLGDAGPDVVE